MKRIFKCALCGVDVEVEADGFIPGVDGVIYDDAGVEHRFVDPTNDQYCESCFGVFVNEILSEITVAEMNKE